MTLAVSKFAVPAPRKGSIDGYSGFGGSAEAGVEIHQMLQALRKKIFANYSSEVATSHLFKTGLFSFEVRGKMDGIFSGTPVRIEEIKSSFNIFELQRRLLESNFEHPYCLQLRTYGYFHWLKTNEIPDLILLLVSTRNSETIEQKIQLDISGYENWLTLRLAELDQEATLALKRAKRRKKTSGNLAFPFLKPRRGQIELIESIESGMASNQSMLLQAPTGLGKTVGVLYPTLREALARGQRSVYVTPKNSQHAVAEDAIERLQTAGANIKAMTLTAKSKMCFKNEPICNPEFCEFAENHYTKVAENKLGELLARKKNLNAKTFKKVAAEFEVCPFELQLESITEADALICDYNYVFAPRSVLGRIESFELGHDGLPNLVIDEAHNLPSRAMDYYSPSLSVYVLEKMRDEAAFLPKKFRLEAQSLLNACIKTVQKCVPPDSAKPCKIKPPLAAFLEQDFELRNFLSTYLKSDIDIQPKDVVLRLCFYWAEFTDALQFVGAGRKEFFTSFSPNPARINITCCDASELLKNSYKNYSQVVGFSATLKPFDFYSRLSGLAGENLKTAEFVSPFGPEQRKLLIIPQVSSKFSERERNYPLIAEAISRIAALKKGNYFAFFPSFDFLNRVLQVFQAPPGFDIIRQQSGMSRESIEGVLNALRETEFNHLVFAVQGGVFSEGVDYPGKMAIGAFVIGPPLPTFDLVREEMRKYYEENYGAGFDYAYTFPAMAKAVQAAGRVIRSETDKGLIVLMDDRFIQPSYSKSMPQEWFEKSARELVSQNILSDVADFWKADGP